MIVFSLNKVLNRHQFSYKSVTGHRVFFAVICKSGLKLSIQASQGHYCSPKKTLPAENYSAFEIGYPSKVVKELHDYAENRYDLLNTIYGWVPVSVIKKIIKRNGGIVAVINQENNTIIKL